MHASGMSCFKAALLGILACNSPATSSNSPLATLPNAIQQTSFFADTPTLEHGSIFFPSERPLTNCLRSAQELTSSWYHDNQRIEQVGTLLALKQLPRDTMLVVSNTTNLVMTELLTPLFTNNGTTVAHEALNKTLFEDMPKRSNAILIAAIECRITRKHYREQVRARKQFNALNGIQETVEHRN